MAASTVFYVGTEQEVGHHAAPLISRRELQVATIDETLRRARPGDVAIFFSEHFQPVREGIRQLKQQQVATLYAIDGILEWRNAWDNLPTEPACPWTMRPALCHKVACIGPSQHRMLSAWGNRKQVELVGVPRFDALISGRPSAEESLDRLCAAGPKRVLVMTAKCPGFTPRQIDTTLRGLRDVRDFFGRQDAATASWQVTWRLTGELDQQLQVGNQLHDLGGGELIEQLRQCDVVVTTPSTAMLEAMILGKPVLLLDYHNVPQWVPAAWTISQAGQLESHLRELLEPAPEARAQVARRFHWQERVLEDALLLRPHATTRMLDLVERMSDEAQRCLAGQPSLEFSGDMLDPYDGGQPAADIGLDFRRLYPNDPEFRRDDLPALQAELAEARRHGHQLQSRIDQLQAELNEAHEIFEQIHRHSIAGPIVRGRQRMIDWWQRRRDRKQKSTDGAKASL